MSRPHRGDGDQLRRGDRSAAVTEIRAALAALGHLDGADADLTTGDTSRSMSSTTSSTMRFARFSSTAGCWSTASSAKPPTAR